MADNEKTKQNHLAEEDGEFQLIETILWTAEKGCFLLDGHMSRLTASAEHFNFKFDRQALLEELDKTGRELGSGINHKLRLLLSRDGGITITQEPISAPAPEAPPTIIVSSEPVNSDDNFLYHKTTHRDFYTRNLVRYNALGYYDVIFENEKGQLTEGTWNNLVVKLGNSLITPPVECGLLNGVYRKHLIKKGIVSEQVLTKADLGAASEIFCCNSVRKTVAVKYHEK